MPILINKDTGLAENLPDDSALRAGTHEVPLVDPEGNAGSASFEDARNLVQQGYKQPNSEQLKALHEKGKYETTGQQLKTGLEGAASALTFGASTNAEVNLGIAKKEDILKRLEHNPGSHALGELGGIGASLLTGAGEAAILERAGSLGAETLGLGAAEAAHRAVALGREAGMSAGEAAQLGKVAAQSFSGAGRVGSAAAKAAAENIGFQFGNEHERIALSDPTLSAESVASHLGLAALVGGVTGGALGVASEGWNQVAGPKLERLMSTLKNRSAGIPEEFKSNIGIEIPPEVQAGLSDNEYAQRAFQKIKEGDSYVGAGARERLAGFESDMRDAAGAALGKDPEMVEDLVNKNVSEYDTGKEIQKKLSDAFKEKYEPIQKSYDELAEKFKAAEITPDIKARIGNNIADMVGENNFNTGPSDAPMNLIRRVLEDLDKQNTAQDLRLYSQNLKQAAPFGSENYRVGKMLAGILDSGKDSTMMAKAGVEAPELATKFRDTQLAYKDIRTMMEDLNSRLHVGKHYGPESFLNNLREMSPEDVLRRLGPKGDIDLGILMNQHFPQVSAAVRSHELNKIIQAAGKNGKLDLNKLFSNVEKMGEDLRNFAISPEAQNKLGMLKTVSDKLRNQASFPEKIADKIWSKVPPAASGLIAMLGLKGNPVADFIIGHTVGTVGREAADGVRLALLKFLGSSSEISAEGLRAAAQVTAAVGKSESMLSNGVKNVFGAGGKVIPFPSPKVIKALEEQVKKVAANDPEQQKDMMSIGGATGHYMPDHAAALAMTASRNLQYLASLRPVDKALSPLDSDPVPSSEQQGKYQRALQIAEQPLILLNSVKNGSITSEDMNHLHMMYPALYTRMNQKMLEQLVDKPKLPYSTKMGVASFMGQPLDSTLMPASISGIQQSLQMLPGKQMNMPNVNPSATAMKGLEKMPGLNRTPDQARQYHRAK